MNPNYNHPVTISAECSQELEDILYFLHHIYLVIDRTPQTAVLVPATPHNLEILKQEHGENKT